MGSAALSISGDGTAMAGPVEPEPILKDLAEEVPAEIAIPKAEAEVEATAKNVKQAAVVKAKARA